MTIQQMQQKVTDFITKFEGDDRMCPLAFAEFLKAAVGLPSHIVAQTVLFGVAPVVTLDDGAVVLLGPDMDTVQLYIDDFFREADLDEDEIEQFKDEGHRLFRRMPDITEYLGLSRYSN